MRARSSLYILISLYLLPLFIVAGGIIQCVVRENYMVLTVLILLLVFIYTVYTRYVFDAVVDKDGILLNQKIPIEWSDTKWIRFIPILRVFIAKVRIEENNNRVILFPSEKARIYFGFMEDNMVNIVKTMKKKYGI